MNHSDRCGEEDELEIKSPTSNSLPEIASEEPEDPPDRQREIRERFKETMQEYREEMQATARYDSPEVYGSVCPRIPTASTDSDKPSTKSDKSLHFTIGGKSFYMDDPRTLSEIFHEKFGEESAARVYGYSTESLDYLKAHPEFVIPGPNPMRIPHNEVLGVLDGFTNIYLSHEISVSPEFRLQRYVPPEDSMTYRVQEQMKKAFWDIFDEHLNETPPNYNQALSVFEELKESLLSLLLPHNLQMRHRINTILELKYIEACVNDGTFTMPLFQRYSDFIIDTLGKLCCPSRDQDVAALRLLERPSEIFQGIMEVMEKMKLDMANFFIMQFRPNIVQHCAQSERLKLADYMEMEYRLNSDGLRATRKWLLRHRVLGRDTDLAQAKAFGELLNYTSTEPFPEVLLLDVHRCVELANSMTRLSIIGAIILTVGALAQSYFKPLPFDFRSIVKKHMLILMPIEDMNDKKKFAECIERAAEQAAFIINEMTKKAVKRRLTSEETETIRTCVREVSRPQHKIRSLLARRILDHAEQVAIVKRDRDRVVTVPSGLSSITHELTVSISEFRRLISHNRRVFSDIYAGILSDEMPHPTYPCKPGEPWDPSYVRTIELLRQNIIKESSSVDSVLGTKIEKAVRFQLSSAETPAEAEVATSSQPVVSEIQTERAPGTEEAVIGIAEQQIEDEEEEGEDDEEEEGDEEEGDEDEGDEEEGDEEEEGEEEEEEDEGEEEGAVGQEKVEVVAIPELPKLPVKRERIPGARIELYFIPRGLPKKYFLKSGADGISRLIPNLEAPVIKKKKKKRRKAKKAVAKPPPHRLPPKRRTPGAEGEAEEGDEDEEKIKMRPNDLLWSQIEKRELRTFCCGKPPTPPPRPGTDES